VSAFSVPLFKPQKKARKVSLSDIEKLERKVSSHLVPALSIESSAQQVSSFFTAAKSFVREFGDDEKMRPFFWSSFQQIDHLAEAFEEYEKDASLAYEAVGSYLRSVNSFLVDSGKIVGFNELDGSLGFQFLAGATKQASGSYYPLDSLSSGERQIIILLSFMAFMLDRDKVFIVDEPELSLHPKWQANFLASIIEQAPPDTQIVLATHSPEIAAGRRENCIILDAI
jgi:ribulose bisphosphate carboxylase small subunit